jgi:predicted transcriptional regulator of viral defense system
LDQICPVRYKAQFPRRSATPGYLLELYNLGTPTLIESLQAMVGTAHVRLDPLLPVSGHYLARWRLRLNVEPDMLQAIVGT